jgi:nucleotide-binding universal stress UspA family protein
VHVLAAAGASRAQLLVLATERYSALRPWGDQEESVTQRVLRCTTAPVLLVRPRDDLAGPLSGPRVGLRVLVPVDGSPRAAEVLPAAAHLAGGPPGEVTLLQVVEPPPEATAESAEPPVFGFPAAVLRALARLGVEQGLETLAGRVRRQTAARTAVVPADDVAAAIIDHAVAEASDVIALTTHGAGSGGRWPPPTCSVWWARRWPPTGATPWSTTPGIDLEQMAQRFLAKIPLGRVPCGRRASWPHRPRAPRRRQWSSPTGCR